MLRHVFIAVIAFACGSFAVPGWAAAPKKKLAKPDPAFPTVEKILRAEVAGAVDRRGQLAETLKQQPDSHSARWQAGFVKDGDSWRSFDHPARNNVLAGILDEYRRRREEAPQTFAGQLNLANWSHKQGLKDLERVHLLVALSLTPEDGQPALLERLGYTQIRNQWISDEQRRDWESAARQTEESLKRWSSKLEHIAPRLTGSKVQHEAALAVLRTIDDASAIPAIELVLAGRNEDTAQAAVEALRRIEGPEASFALTRQGLFSPWATIRKSATVVLKERKLEDFVPSIISLLTTPAQGSLRVLCDPSHGALIYSYIVAAETDNQFHVATFRAVSPVIIRGVFAPSGALDRSYVLDIDTAASQVSAQNLLNIRNYQRENLNDRIEELNGFVIAVLAELSGSEPTPDVRKWWQWWYDFTDTNAVGTKPVVTVSEEVTSASPVAVFALLKNSCFALGTPVWTEVGMQAIETIKVGDRVLAKDVETGELAYKPVLQTTVRMPKELTTLRFGDETIVCTGGHRFWNSGSGWIKARDLNPQMLLHTVTGNTPVWSAKKGNSAETYNLVVADFHTYFVGKTGVLCQDLLIPRGTNNVVPGLSRK